MTYIDDKDQKLLETLGLQDIPEQEKKVVLDEIDRKMSQRYIANLLSSIPPEKINEVQAEIEKIPSGNTQKIIEKIIELHPNSADILKKSAEEIIDQLKQDRKTEDKMNQDVSSDLAPADDRITPHGTVGALDDRDNEAAIDQPGVSKIEEASTPNTAPPIDPAKADPFAPADEEAPADTVEKAGKTSSMPVAEQEPNNPFGDEIKLVKNDDEPNPAETPALPTSPQTPIAETTPFQSEPASEPASQPPTFEPAESGANTPSYQPANLNQPEPAEASDTFSSASADLPASPATDTFAAQSAESASPVADDPTPNPVTPPVSPTPASSTTPPAPTPTSPIDPAVSHAPTASPLENPAPTPPASPPTPDYYQQ